MARVVENVSTGVLGLTMGCVRCHSHKFEPIPHEDYYRLMAVFATAYNLDDWLRPVNRILPAVSHSEQAEVGRFNAQIDARIAERQKRRPLPHLQALWDVGKPPAVHQLMRGSADTPGPVVDAGFVTVLCPPGKSAVVRPPDVKGNSSGRRLALAHWLTRRDHPLTAR